VPITTKVVSLKPISWRGVLNTTLCDKVCQWLEAGRWFSPVSSTNKTDSHDITEILLIMHPELLCKNVFIILLDSWGSKHIIVLYCIQANISRLKGKPLHLCDYIRPKIWMYFRFIGISDLCCPLSFSD
jgi:hypothetical protein